MGCFELVGGMYFCAPGPCRIEGGEGMLVRREDHAAAFLIGGPIEPSGRLPYVDGCTTSLLVPPAVRGDPCLHQLCIPPGTIQREHFHPSVRVGLVASGSGCCIMDQERWPLEVGQSFILRPGALHHFETETSALCVITYHPDSDFGPSAGNHPMWNQTLRRE